MRMGKMTMNPIGSTNEVERIAVVLGHPGSDGQHVGVEDNIRRRHTNLLCQNEIGAFANGDATL